jgi:PAS domain S-box-containing protein
MRLDLIIQLIEQFRSRMAQQRYFDRYTLLLDPLQLMEGQHRIDLPQRPLEVLATLVQADGGAVSKQKLMELVWKSTYVDVGNITQAIFQLRRALGKRHDGGEFIETVSGEGYRLAPSAQPSLQPSNDRRSRFRPIAATIEQSHFQRLVESIEDYAIYMLDCAGRVRTWNAGAQRTKGFLKAEAIGRHFSMFFPPEDVASGWPEQELAKAARLGHFSGEGWRLRKNGERFWASFVITAMRSSDGRLIGFAKVVRDLTESKRQQDSLLRAQAELRRERDMLAAAAECSMDGLYICEAIRGSSGEIEDFAFTYLNSNVEKRLAVPREVLLGGRMCELLPYHRSLGLFDRYKAVVETRQPFVDEFLIHHTLVTPEWVRVQALPLGDGLAITSSDITARKHAEQRAADLAKELEMFRSASAERAETSPREIEAESAG